MSKNPNFPTFGEMSQGQVYKIRQFNTATWSHMDRCDYHTGLLFKMS